MRAEGIGERVRALRVAAGLTQTDLAGGRFSKEYVSQIERGKTRPTADTLDWLAEKLGVDPDYLESGVSSEDRARAEAGLARAEALSEIRQYDEALDEFVAARDAVERLGARDLELRSLLGESWALIQVGRSSEALELLARARELADWPMFSDVDRAGVLFRLGVARYKLSSIETVGRAALRGARAGRPLGSRLGLPPRRHPRLALPLLPAPARLAGGARGRRAGARARPGWQTTSRRPRMRTSRPLSSPSARGSMYWRVPMRNARVACTRSWPTAETSVG